jgi:hypothetical protein
MALAFESHVLVPRNEFAGLGDDKFSDGGVLGAPQEEERKIGG